MIDFKIGEYDYRVSKLDAMSQFHVSRLLGPVLGILAEGRKDANGKVLESTPAQAAAAITSMMGGLDKADCDTVIATCLGRAQTFRNQAWVDVTTKSGAIMFDDIDLSTMMQIVVAALREARLPDFFRLSDTPAEQSRQTAGTS